MTGAPVKTYTNAHPNGVEAVDISDDCLFLVTLGVFSVRIHYSIFLFTLARD